MGKLGHDPTQDRLPSELELGHKVTNETLMAKGGPSARVAHRFVDTPGATTSHQCHWARLAATRARVGSDESQ